MLIGELLGPDILIIGFMSLLIIGAVAIAVLVLRRLWNSANATRLLDGTRVPETAHDVPPDQKPAKPSWSWRKRLGVFVALPGLLVGGTVFGIHNQAAARQASYVTTPSLSDFMACSDLIKFDRTLFAGHFPGDAAFQSLVVSGELATHEQIRAGIMEMNQGYTEMVAEQGAGISTQPGFYKFNLGGGKARIECNTLKFPSGTQ
jgi:hypothetical protein